MSNFKENGPVYFEEVNEYTKKVSEIFVKFLKEKLSIDDIRNIHKKINNEEILSSNTDQSTLIHKTIYEEFDKDIDSELVKIYRKLTLNSLKSLSEYFGIDEWAIQRYPSFRVHFPNNLSVFEFHRDSDYNHPYGEINQFLAITNCWNSSALHLEKTFGWENYIPLNLKAGESAFINTSIFKHGDFPNKTEFTRFSIDFRFIPIFVLNKIKEKSSLTAKRKFNTDDYFMIQ
tara:strand:+ start:128 stop:820 length:693 start_codon:yes stop_codon:yes gene_type:complete